MYKDDLRVSSFIVIASQQYITELFSLGAERNIHFMQHWRDFVVIIRDPVDRAFRNQLVSLMDPEGKMLLLASKNNPQKLCPVSTRTYAKPAFATFSSERFFQR